MEALCRIPQGVRSRLNTFFSDLTAMAEVNGRLAALLYELQHMRAKMIDLQSFERAIEKMPKLLRRVVIALAERLNASIEGGTKLAAQAEEAVKLIGSLSFSSTGGHAQ